MSTPTPPPTPLNDRLGRIVRPTAPWSRPLTEAADRAAQDAAQHLYRRYRAEGLTAPRFVAIWGNTVRVEDRDTGRTMRLTIVAEEE